MSRVGSTSALLTKINTLMHTKTKFCDVVEPNAILHSAILFGLNCMFALLAGGPLGHVAHLHNFHPRTLVSDWLVHRARGEREARPEVERSLKSAGLTSSRVPQEVRGAKKLVLY